MRFEIIIGYTAFFGCYMLLIRPSSKSPSSNRLEISVDKIFVVTFNTDFPYNYQR